MYLGDKMKKTFLLILMALVSGSMLGKLTLDRYEKTEEVVSYETNLYMLKINTYNNISEMNDKITKAIVYIELKPKERTVAKVNLEEQYLQLNNFLYSKLGLAPIKYGNGYIYKFLNFKTIDLSLKTFMKAINSEAPVDYMVILQAYEGSEDFAYMEIFKLRTTGIYNTIIMAPTTNIRYEYIKDAVYTTGIIGRYMIENDDVSIYEIREKFF
jgi:hypothetical protein